MITRRLAATAVSLIAMMGLTACDLNIEFGEGGRPSPTVEAPNVNVEYQPNIDASQARSILATLPVKDDKAEVKYEREEQFGEAWEDVDGNGCDNRNDILNRDLTERTYRDAKNCKVETGVLTDPYTGVLINFQYGQDTSSAVQIDHIAPLSYVWHHGGDQLTQEQRLQIANDPENLLAVDGPANGCKSDAGMVKFTSQKTFDKNDSAGCEYRQEDVQGMSEDDKVIVVMPWLPNEAFRCDATQQFIYVLDKYGLSIGSADKTAAENILATCS